MFHPRPLLLLIPFFAILIGSATVEAQRSNRVSNGIYKNRIEPNWIGDGDQFWYRNSLEGGKREFILVDAVTGRRNDAFDHQKLAAALTEAGVAADLDRLPIRNLSFDLAANRVTFSAANKNWAFDLATSKLMPGPVNDSRDTEGLKPLAEMPRPLPNGEETSIAFVNRTKQPVEIFWVAAPGNRTRYATLKPDQVHEQHTFAGHVWQVVGERNRTIAYFQADAVEDQALIEEGLVAQPNRRNRPRRRERFQRQANPVSPDGKWKAEVKDHNVVIQSVDTGETFQLSEDGSQGNGYRRLSWSPDSRSLAAFRVQRFESKKVYRLNSALGPNEFRAELQEQNYPLPGDEFDKYEPNVFDISNRKQIKPEVDLIDFGNPRFRWHSDHQVTYQKVDRGHQRFRLVEIDGLSGQARNIIDESSKTFIWTMHRDVMRYPTVSWLTGDQEIIYVSEQDGHRHLFLIDVESGELKQTITPGEYVVTGVDLVDEENRQVWFRASGLNQDQDPYFTHFYRVDFDGNNLVHLTQGDGTHSVTYSPHRKFYIDTYSRVDMPPIHELRKSSTGELICELERTETASSGWRPPTVFVTKGRDEQTDIWGMIAFPEQMDPNRKYPVIEDIYAGPQGFFTPKAFSARDRYRELTDMGFVVVKLDGMGTAGRSKAFHDVCWHNLKDAGFPDRIKWIKAAAEKYPCMDTSRVGIYGTSAGGQSAAGAVLFHGDFYDVAVASCGCHDNRMDKASWNEQWMGYPVGPHYAESSNIDNASKLTGELMLIIGEVDNNVPPASTFKLADSLIKAKKDFELVYLPGVGHSSGGAYGNRKRVEFFRKHLLTPDAQPDP